MNVNISESWKSHLQSEFNKPYFNELVQFVKNEYKNHVVSPSGKKIFSAFDHCSFDDVKVVIIGQDPYHGPGQANGLCFSVGDGVRKPPSLLNIFKELNADLGKPIPDSGNLESYLGFWAENVIWMPPNAPIMQGKSTIREYVQPFFEQLTIHRLPS